MFFDSIIPLRFQIANLLVLLLNHLFIFLNRFVEKFLNFTVFGKNFLKLGFHPLRNISEQTAEQQFKGN